MATPTVLLILVVVLVLAALVFGIVSLLSGDDPGLGTAEPDGRAVPLPNNRSLTETDLKTVRFDLGWRGYRMAQVDRVLRRTAYDVGYKDEMIAVLEAEVLALREGRAEDAELLRGARESAANPSSAEEPPAGSETVITLSGSLTVESEIAVAVPASWEISPAASDVIDFGSERGDEPDAAAPNAQDEAYRAYTANLARSATVGQSDTAAEVQGAGAGAEVEAPPGSDVVASDEDEAARQEEARKEASTPGRIADRGRHGSGGRSSGRPPRRTPGPGGGAPPSGKPASGKPTRGASTGDASTAATSTDGVSTGRTSAGGASAGGAAPGGASAGGASNGDEQGSGPGAENGVAREGGAASGNGVAPDRTGAAFAAGAGSENGGARDIGGPAAAPVEKEESAEPPADRPARA